MINWCFDFILQWCLALTIMLKCIINFIILINIMIVEFGTDSALTVHGSWKWFWKWFCLSYTGNKIVTTADHVFVIFIFLNAHEDNMHFKANYKEKTINFNITCSWSLHDQIFWHETVMLAILYCLAFETNKRTVLSSKDSAKSNTSTGF